MYGSTSQLPATSTNDKKTDPRPFIKCDFCFRFTITCTIIIISRTGTIIIDVSRVKVVRIAASVLTAAKISDMLCMVAKQTRKIPGIEYTFSFCIGLVRKSLF